MFFWQAAQEVEDTKAEPVQEPLRRRHKQDPAALARIVDIAFTRELRSIEDAPKYLRPQYPKHWSFVHSVPWWKHHWEKTGLVEVTCDELLTESDQLLRDYVQGRPREQDEDSIMRAVPSDHEGLIALFCMVACKR